MGTPVCFNRLIQAFLKQIELSLLLKWLELIGLCCLWSILYLEAKCAMKFTSIFSFRTVDSFVSFIPHHNSLSPCYWSEKYCLPIQPYLPCTEHLSLHPRQLSQMFFSANFGLIESFHCCIVSAVSEKSLDFDGYFLKA